MLNKLFHFMKCDIVIISYNNKVLVENCINSAHKTSKNLIQDIIVVDNFSQDGTCEYISRKFPHVKLICLDKNYGYSFAVNRGVEKCTSEFVIISNSDVIFTENSIEILLQKLQKGKNTAVCFPRQIFPDGSYQYSYGDLPSILAGLKDIFLINSFENFFRELIFNKFGIDFPKYRFGYADGAILAVKRHIFNQIGGFDESFFFYSEDADFSLRVRKNGYKIKFCPKSRIIHLRGGSSDPNKFSYETTKKLALSKLTLAKKHLSMNTFRFYAISQIIKSSILLLLFKLLDCKNKKFKNEIEFHNNNKIIWKEILSESNF